MNYKGIIMKKILLTLAVAGTLSGCGVSSAPPENDYSASSIRKVREVLKVTIISKRRVKVASDKATGKLAGAAIGATIGNGSAGGMNGEKTVAGIVGAIVGSAIGESIEGSSKQYFAIEYVVQDANENLRSVVVNNDDLIVGDKAFLIVSDRPVLRKIPSGVKKNKIK